MRLGPAGRNIGIQPPHKGCLLWIKTKEMMNEEKKIMNSSKLAKRIVDCLSDGYDDEENRKEVERALYNDLSQLKEDSIVKAAILRMCETIEELTE